jgi:hypothetical protein
MACHSVLHRVAFERLIVDDSHALFALPAAHGARAAGGGGGVVSAAAAKARAKAQALSLVTAARRWCLLSRARAPHLSRRRDQMRALVGAVGAPAATSLHVLVPALVLELD